MIDLRPSGSYIWTNCAASARFGLNSPDQPDTDASREGTCAAWLAEMVLDGKAIVCADLLDATHENGWIVEQDMVDFVQEYVDMIRNRGGVIQAEKFVRLNEFIAGTSDCSATVMGDTLYVDDLKYGYGPVEVYRNPQLGIYGAACLDELEHMPSKVQLGIYQPRGFHPDGIYRTWTMTPDELRQFGQDIIERGYECQNPNSVATPGEHCKHCRSNLSCVAIAHTNYANYEVVQSPRQSQISLAQLSAEKDFLDRAAKILEARKSAVDAELEQQIRGGAFVSGWGLVEGKGRRKFVVSPETVQAWTGIDPHKKVLKSPSEIEKEGNAATKRAVKFLAKTPTTGFKLTKTKPGDIAKQFETKGN